MELSGLPQFNEAYLDCTLTVEGGSFDAAVVVEGDGTMNVNGGSFTGTDLDKVTYGNGAKGTVSGGSFADLY